MRRRSTFILKPGSDYDPSEIKVQGNFLSLAGIEAAREERLTFGLDHLPADVVHVLQASHELHIRWVSERSYIKIPPYISSLTPGLHVHYTPLKSNDDGQVCQLLHTLFSSSLRCTTSDAAFSRPRILSERFASAASMQYYSLLHSLSHFVAYIQRTICSPSEVLCTHSVALLNIADYMDIDYDSISHTLTLTAFWSKPPAVLMDPVGEWTTYDHWNIAIQATPDNKNEIGIFESTPASDPHDLQLEGLLAVVGEDERPKSTMFFFPSRHHILQPSQQKGQAYKVSFEQPTGLHPKMCISFPSTHGLQEPSNKPADSTCALHTYITLPSVLFADEYAFPTPEYPDQLFTEAHNILSLRSISGELDLEAPDYVISKWGSAILLELATPSISIPDAPWNITLPLHLRYLAPNSGGVETVTIPDPIVFWACTAEEGTKFSVNPFDRVNLGYDGLFGPRTMFFHIDAAPAEDGQLVQNIYVPVLDTLYLSHGQIELVTMTVVLLGFLWVAVKVWRQMKWEMDWWAKKENEGFGTGTKRKAQ